MCLDVDAPEIELSIVRIFAPLLKEAAIFLFWRLFSPLTKLALLVAWPCEHIPNLPIVIIMGMNVVGVEL